ncbi:cytochrome-c peroxidase [Candidatus Venteria ishoeyi]|uniref:Cytochrome c551 peroxidase n=1 Tax=Candidatus Venteria ishoeyi TaxID=1899563 RepID=A0A1H6FI57_9GAMM|nr:cytochrome c peroxidase [Candidatus Venteria ishoeyi]SEH09059.1 Cytochrome c551 peroxidase precursor [Candidatus Venteria ishoeyi]
MFSFYRITNTGFYIGLLILLSACGGGGGGSPTSETPLSPQADITSETPAETSPIVASVWDQQLMVLIQEHELSGDPRKQIFPSIESPLAQLGRDLFFSKALGGDVDVACVSCHHPMLGGADDLPLAVGVSAELPDVLGPGRKQAAVAGFFDGGPNVARNTPTVFNAGLWQKVLLHDGGIERLEQGIRSPETQFGQPDPNVGADLVTAQNRFPLSTFSEMRGFSFFPQHLSHEYRQQIALRLSQQSLPNYWLTAFQQAFNSDAGAETLIDISHISEALGAYVNSMIFVESPWKAYVEGDLSALSDTAKRGAITFFSSHEQGGGACFECHQGDFFTDEDFHVLAIPQIGRGKGHGITGDDDFGRFNATKNPQDRHAFRTPSLLNVGQTAPYGHSGAYLTLEAIIRHQLDINAAVIVYDYQLAALSSIQAGIQQQNAKTNTENALADLQKRTEDQEKLPVINMSDEQIDELAAFLHSLTDPCILDRACLAPWLPDNHSGGPDHLRLNAVNQQGDLL